MTWIWRGTVAMDVTVERSEGEYEHGFTYRFRNTYPGRWVPGSNRSQWKGTLAWEFDGYSYRPAPGGGDGGMYCTYKGSGRFHTRAWIYFSGGEGAPPRLAVGVFPSDFPRDGPTIGKVVRTCPGGSVEEVSGRSVFGYIPVVTSFELVLPRRTRSVSRTVQTPVRWEWGEIYNLKQPVRVVFRRTR